MSDKLIGQPIKYHIIVIYGILVLGAAFVSSSLSGSLYKITKLEFYQEATRIRDNVVGFKQVSASLANNSEKTKNCTDSESLRAEWTSDLSTFKDQYKEFIKSEVFAQNYYDSIAKLNETITQECGSLK